MIKAFNKKKKMILLLLLVVSIAIFSGFGIYSYYFIKGSLSNSSNISILLFDPEVSLNYKSPEESADFDFIGTGDTYFFLDCNTNSESYVAFIDTDTTVTCEKNFYIKNNGKKTIRLEIDDDETEAGSYNENLIDYRIGSVNYSFSKDVLAPGEAATLRVYTDVDIQTYFLSQDPYQLYSPFIPDDVSYQAGIEVQLDVHIRATEVHE